MRKISREELLSLDSYETQRPQRIERQIAQKQFRRVALGPAMTLVFENRDTMLFQVQEMLRTERITREEAIAHELATYNELVPDQGHLSATLFIEVDDKDARRELLTALATLPGELSLVLGPHPIQATFHENPGEEEGRLPAVNYLRFGVPDGARRDLGHLEVPAAVVVSHPAYQARTVLAAETRAQLLADLS